MNAQRLDQALVERGQISSRSQAETYIKLGRVTVNGRVITKPNYRVLASDKIGYDTNEQYVSRAGLKLASVAAELNLNFQSQTVLDVGSSTGGFTDYALQHGASKVIAVDVGTDQLHPSLSNNPKVELHEQTDIRNFRTNHPIGLILIDVSFISLRDVLPHIRLLSPAEAIIVAMVKPQFEAGKDNLKHKGVIKNDHIRRDILKSFEQWLNKDFIVIAKADSKVAGEKGNLERFYKLRIAAGS